MSVSLTSAGLYLEPRVYVNAGSGNNYGTPRVVSSSGTSLGGGSWSGIYFYFVSSMGIKAESNVSTSSGGGFTSEYPNSISRKGKGGGLNVYVYRWFGSKAFLSYCNLLWHINSSYRSSMCNRNECQLPTKFQWGSISSDNGRTSKSYCNNKSKQLFISLYKSFLAPLRLVKEVA